MTSESAGPEGRVVHLGGRLDYQDGAESRLIEILRSADDLSDGSDELTAQIIDWPTLYHLSPLRSNLLRPLCLRPGMRVLEVGCGSGAMLRYLGEQGVEATGLEGNPDRARAAAIRCGDLTNVTVVCGQLDEFRAEPFDLVLLIGVLEYAGRHHPTGYHGFLDQVSRLVGEHGMLAVAVENQIGLKYLIGYNEDHLGLPWVGVEGYRRNQGIRTWSRRELGRLLDGVGLNQRRWLYPYPDYKLPTHIFTDSLLRRPEGPQLVAKFLRNPVVDRSAEPALVCDAAGAHEVMLGAGLGEEVANSFLVLSAGRAEVLEEMMHPEDGWLFSQQRLRPWRRARSLSTGPDGYRLVPFGVVPALPEPGWLVAETPAEEKVHPGFPLDKVVARALADGDLENVRKLLEAWWSHLSERAGPADPESRENPFLPAGSTLTLPGNLIDANLDNFLLDGDRMVHVDTELVARPAVDAVFVATRALRYLAERAVLGGWIHPWTRGETVAEVHATLCDWAGLPPERPDAVAVASAEGELQKIVVGTDPAEGIKVAAVLSGTPMFNVDDARVPFTTLAAELQAVKAESERRIGTLTEELRRAAAGEEESRAALSEATALAGELDARANELQATLGGMESSRSWRVTRPLRLVREKLHKIRWPSFKY